MARTPIGTPDWGDDLNTDLDGIEARAIDARRILVSSVDATSAYTLAAPDHGIRRIRLTLKGNVTLGVAGGSTSEVCTVSLDLRQDAIGSRTVVWPDKVDWGLAGPPTLTTTPNKVDQVDLSTDNGGASWRGVLVAKGFDVPATDIGLRVVGMDTDGRPYYDRSGGLTHSVFLDTDGVPYFSTSAGGETVLEDTDGVPYLPILA